MRNYLALDQYVTLTAAMSVLVMLPRTLTSLRRAGLLT